MDSSLGFVTWKKFKEADFITLKTINSHKSYLIKKRHKMVTIFIGKMGCSPVVEYLCSLYKPLGSSYYQTSNHISKITFARYRQKW